MGRIIARNVVERKEGHLYYVDGAGNVCEAKMARGGRRKKTATRKKASTRKKAATRRPAAKKTATRRRR